MLSYVFAAVALGLLIALVILGVVLYVLVGLHREERDVDRAYHTHERDVWEAERRELLNRLQHPNLVPTGRRVPKPPDPAAAAARVQQMRELASVGRVVPSNDDGLDGLP